MDFVATYPALLPRSINVLSATSSVFSTEDHQSNFSAPLFSPRSIHPMPASHPITDENSQRSLFVAPFLSNKNLSQRQPARAPVPSSKQLVEQRRKQYFTRLSNDRHDRRFEQRAEEMMQSTYAQEHEQWMAEMARVAESLPHVEQEVEDKEEMQDAVPSDVEELDRLDANDLQAIDMWSEERDMQHDDSFGSEDESDDFTMLLSQVAEQYERGQREVPSVKQSGHAHQQQEDTQMQHDSMDLT